MIEEIVKEQMMVELPYLAHYPASLQSQIKMLLEQGKLGNYLLAKYPCAHLIANDKALYTYVMAFKNQFLRKSESLSKIVYDGKIGDINDALGLHRISIKNHGGRLRSKSEIRIATLFKKVPEAFLKMIVVHELAHLKEKQHNKAFYALCEAMEPHYHQLEFDLRIYLMYLEKVGKLY